MSSKVECEVTMSDCIDYSNMLVTQLMMLITRKTVTRWIKEINVFIHGSLYSYDVAIYT